MSLISQLIVRIGGDNSGFMAMTASTQKAAQQMATKLNSIGNTLTLGLTLPLAAAGAAAVRTFADFEALEKGIAAVEGSTAAAAIQLKRIEEIAKLPGLGFREAAKGYTQLRAAFRDFGDSANLSERSLKAFGNALATVGKGKAELDGVTMALSQIASKGKISAEEINQLAERLPQIRNAMKDAFGTADTEVLQKRGIGVEEFIAKIVSEFEKLPPVTGGMKNDLENLKDQFDRTMNSLGKAAAPAVSAALSAMNPLLAMLGDLGKGFAALPQPVQTASIALLALAAASGPIAKLSSGILTLLPLITGPTGLAVAFGTIAVAGIGYGIMKLTEVNAKLDETYAAMERGKKAVGEYGGAWDKTAGESLTNALGIKVRMKPAIEATTKAVIEQAPAVEAVKIHWMGLSETLHAIEQSKAAKKLSDDMAAIFDRARSPQTPIWEMGLPPDLNKTKEELSQIDQILRAMDPQLAKLPPPIAKAGAETKKTTRDMGEFGREVQRAFDGMSRRLARNIVEWRGWKDSGIQAAKDFASGALEIMIQRLLDPLKKKAADALAGLFGGVVSGGSSAAGSAVSSAIGIGGSAASTAGSAASGAGKAASGAASGVMGTLGAVGSLGSMVSGIIGNFQFAGMNKTLDLLEKSMRYVEIMTKQIIDEFYHPYLPRLKDIQGYISEMYTGGIKISQWPAGLAPMAAATPAGSGDVNINITGGYFLSDRAMDDFADALASRMRQRGLIR